MSCCVVLLHEDMIISLTLVMYPHHLDQASASSLGLLLHLMQPHEHDYEHWTFTRGIGDV